LNAADFGSIVDVARVYAALPNHLIDGRFEALAIDVASRAFAGEEELDYAMEILSEEWPTTQAAFSCTQSQCAAVISHYSDVVRGRRERGDIVLDLPGSIPDWIMRGDIDSHDGNSLYAALTLVCCIFGPVSQPAPPYCAFVNTSQVVAGNRSARSFASRFAYPTVNPVFDRLTSLIIGGKRGEELRDSISSLVKLVWRCRIT